MPYVKQEVRPRLDAGGIPKNAGELNYLITKILTGYFVASTPKGLIRSLVRDLLNRYLAEEELRYQRLNDAQGALICAWMEFARRIMPKIYGDPLKFDALLDLGRDIDELSYELYSEVAIPYEDAKIKENGDVYS